MNVFFCLPDAFHWSQPADESSKSFAGHSICPPGALSGMGAVVLLLHCLLCCISVALTGNLIIVAIVTSDPHLHTTMYFLLGNLSFLDFCYSSITAPRMLVDLLLGSPSISFGACLTYLFFFYFTGSIKIFLLTVMAYDCYVAISQPLRYTFIMNQTVCGLLMTASWVGGFIHSIVQVVLTIQLPFCGPDKLDNFYCHVPQLIKLACTDTSILELLMVSNNGLLILMCFLVLLGSYTALLVML